MLPPDEPVSGSVTAGVWKNIELELPGLSGTPPLFGLMLL